MKIKKFEDINENKNNTSLKELYHTYEIEGHGYAVENYLTCDDDPEVAILWNNASESLRNKVDNGTLEFFLNINHSKLFLISFVYHI